jgi:E3 SUMO-protein ligase PIAS1
MKQEPGPQFPTDITKMLKYGANIIQAVGYFNGRLGHYAMLSKLYSNTVHQSAPIIYL